MKRRVRTLYPGYLVGTKGHSVLKKKTYTAARRPSLDVEDIVIQRMPISRKTVVDYSYPDNVYNHASAYSSAVVDDCYDLHNSSRGRDHHLLSKMNNALHPEEFDPKTTLSSPSSRSSMSRNYPKRQHTSHLSSPNPEPYHSSSETSCTDLVPFLQTARNQLAKSQPFCTRSNLGTGNKTFTSLLHENRNDHDSPLTAYIKGKWNTNVPSPTLDHSLSSNLHHPLFATEDTSSRTLSLPKYSYLDSTDFSSDEEDDAEPKYSHHNALERKRPYKPGEVLKALRRKRRERDERSDNNEGAYAIVYKDEPEADDENTEAYTDDEYEYKPLSVRNRRYLKRESSPEDDTDLPLTPYHSKLHKYEDYDDDIGLSSLVAMATLRARDALRHITGVDSKAGFLSIEGDFRPHGGELSTFKLESPFQMRGPLMINQRPKLTASDNAFENLVMKLRNQREEEREKLDSNFLKRKPPLQLTHYSPSEYSIRPLGYMSDEYYNSYTKALMPCTTGFDRTLVSSSTPAKSVHFDEEFERKSSSSFLRELYPDSPVKRDEEEMAVAPRRKRYPIYEYTEEIPVKLKVGDDSDCYEDITTGRLSVIEKIRIKLSTQLLRSSKGIVAARRATHISAAKAPHHVPVYKEVDLTSPAYHVSPLRYFRGYNKRFVMAPKHNPYVMLSNWGDYFDDEDLYFPQSKLRYYPTGVDRYSAMHPLHSYYLRHHLPDWHNYTQRRVYDYVPRRHYRRYYPKHYMALKALLVGDDKLAEPGHPRRARRRYYPDKPAPRNIEENLAMLGIPDTSGLRASKPPGPSAVPTHSWKAIREVEGYTKPQQWEYRLDSHVAPEHQIPKAASSPYLNVRDQVRGVQDKMVRHRQLLDRYSDRPNLDGFESYSPGVSHTSGRSQTDDLAAGDVMDKVSPLRKKIRKVICKSRRDPSYFDE